MQMKRIYRNWRTTSLGVMILLATLLLVYFEKATLKEAGGFLIIAFGLFFSKDKYFVQNFFPKKNSTDVNQQPD